MYCLKRGVPAEISGYLWRDWNFSLLQVGCTQFSSADRWKWLGGLIVQRPFQQQSDTLSAFLELLSLIAHSDCLQPLSTVNKLSLPFLISLHFFIIRMLHYFSAMQRWALFWCFFNLTLLVLNMLFGIFCKELHTLLRSCVSTDCREENSLYCLELRSGNVLLKSNKKTWLCPYPLPVLSCYFFLSVKQLCNLPELIRLEKIAFCSDLNVL